MFLENLKKKMLWNYVHDERFSPQSVQNRTTRLNDRPELEQARLHQGEMFSPQSVQNWTTRLDPIEMTRPELEQANSH